MRAFFVIARSTCDEAIHASTSKMDCLASLAMTLIDPYMSSRSRGAVRPRVCWKRPHPRIRGRREDRVRAAPAVSCAKCTKKRTRAYRFSGGNPAFPAQWFYGLLRALLGDRAFLPPSPARLGANLTPASGCQDHTTSPSASAPFVKGASASTASHRAFRDDREPPLLSGETGRFVKVICPTC